jgi:cytochrome P450 family 135
VATREVVASWPTGEPVVIDDAMRAITLRVIMQTVFGVDGASQSGDLAALLTDMLGLGATPLALVAPLIPEKLRPRSQRWRRFLDDVRGIRARLGEVIVRTRASATLAERTDVLAILAQARDEDGQPMEDEEICDELITLLLAGHDTTAAALSWTVGEILNHPEIQERLTSEVSSAGVQRDYLEAVVKESLRHRTIVPLVVRRLKASLTVGGFELPVGLSVAPCNHLVHHRRDLYPDPQAFQPERFLTRKYGPYEWFPFGGGDRRCLGMAFAFVELKVVLETVFGTLRLERAAAPNARPARRGVLLVPKGGTSVVVRERLERQPAQAVA